MGTLDSHRESTRRLAALLRAVAAGHPVVVRQTLSLAIAPRWHYAVVVGYDLAARELVLRSGTTERELLSLSTFEHTWERSGHWAFVALAPGELPAMEAIVVVAQCAIVGLPPGAEMPCEQHE